MALTDALLKLGEVVDRRGARGPPRHLLHGLGLLLIVVAEGLVPRLVVLHVRDRVGAALLGALLGRGEGGARKRNKESGRLSEAGRQAN